MILSLFSLHDDISLKINQATMTFRCYVVIRNDVKVKSKLRDFQSKKNEKSFCCSRISSSRPWQRLTSLIAVQNSLWRTFFRDWSLWPGTSPDSCSFSSSSMALATSGRDRQREGVCGGTDARGIWRENVPYYITAFNHCWRKSAGDIIEITQWRPAEAWRISLASHYTK